MHAAVGSPDVLPYRPALQSLHDPAPDKLYFPTLHTAAVEFVDPATHAYPAVQFPLHDAVVRPIVAPYVPAGQGAVQFAEAIAAASPYVPGAHGVQDPAPASE